jgi:micrococcal nuclease
MKLRLTRTNKRLIFSLLVLILGALLGVNNVKPNSLTNLITTAQPGQYQVVEVYDGDTIGVHMDGTTEKIRLIGVDTPETHHPNKPVQCFGQAASDYTTKNLSSKTVRLEADPMGDNRDRYDRLLRYVYLPDGTLWNRKLISDGYGFAYTSFAFGKSTDFKQAEQTARQTNAGLWGGCRISSDANGHISSGDADQ